MPPTPTRMLTTLAHTPTWVFAVLVALLFLGYRQSRDRSVSRHRLIVLPLFMLGLSLLGTLSSFGPAALPLLAWGLGALLGALPALGRVASSAGQPVPEALHVRGSWLPLAFMLAVFAIRYGTGYAQARGLPIAAQPWFGASVGGALGWLGGLFLRRALFVLRPCPGP